jgi:D-alanine-D-alanine ligase
MHGSERPAAARLRDVIEATKGRADGLDVTLVCNDRSTAPPDGDFVEHSLASEFYSDDELSQVIGGLRRDGLFVSGVVNEREFLSLPAPQPDGRRHVLMNFGSARRGPWGKTLVPALAEARGWITTNSDAYAIALARHKFHTGALLEGVGIPAARGWCFSPGVGWLGGRRPGSRVVVLVQPAYESASIGVDAGSKRLADGSLEAYCAGLARKFRQDVIVREFIAGYEIEVPVAHDVCHQALGAVGVRIDGLAAVDDRFLTYRHVLADDYGFYAAEDELGAARSLELEQTAEHAAEVLGLRGFCRIDCRIDASTGRAFVTDVSASPHFISHSSFAFAADRCGIDPASLPVALVGLALRRREGSQPSDQC